MTWVMCSHWTFTNALALVFGSLTQFCHRDVRSNSTVKVRRFSPSINVLFASCQPPLRSQWGSRGNCVLPPFLTLSKWVFRGYQCGCKYQPAKVAERWFFRRKKETLFLVFTCQWKCLDRRRDRIFFPNTWKGKYKNRSWQLTNKFLSWRSIISKPFSGNMCKSQLLKFSKCSFFFFLQKFQWKLIIESRAGLQTVLVYAHHH